MLCFRVKRRGWLKHKYSYLYIQTAMSHDSLDEETKRILAEAEPDDSKDETKYVKPKKEYKNDENNEYEVNDNDPLKDSEMDDKEW